jgi:dGTPase
MASIRLTNIYTSRRDAIGNSDQDSFHHDIEAILHSKAYARYADKTQVVYLLPHDHIASRGLHVQLVSAFARWIGRKLGFNEDLIEAISLGHDMGHAPFGHEGEEYLHALSKAAGIGSFSHTRQSCRIASELEPMNLTFAVLDGFLCHDGGMDSRIIDIFPEKTWEDHDAELTMRTTDPEKDLRPATKEGALVKIADTVSYLERDLYDGITLGIVRKEEIPKTIFPTHDRGISAVVEQDIVTNYRKTGVIGLSEPVFNALKQIRSFNFDRIYMHECLKTESQKIHNVYDMLFDNLLLDWRKKGKESLLWNHFLHNKADSYVSTYPPEQLVVDYIAGMTDGYFLRLFEELYLPRTIVVPGVLPFS